MELTGCTALITGASAGLGSEFARQLARRAGALVLVARRGDRLAELRDELAKQNPDLHVHFRAVDLADAKQVSELADWLNQQPFAVDLLINNAGLGDHGAFSTSEPARVQAMLAVNVVALTILTRHLVPGMIARKCGAILNVSSSASFLPIPGMAVYAATKAYVTSLSEALGMELRGSGITVQSLCPGPVHTEFNSIAARANEPRKIAPEIAYVSVEQVVREALAGIERDRSVVIPGLAMKLGMFLIRLTPMWVLRFAERHTPRADSA